MYIRNNYYASSFFWSTFQKVLNAIVGFISVPLLLGYYGKADYGILGIATACNGYMHLLDLGMNIGAVKFFSQWKAEGKKELINRVARTNITFYGIIAIINMLGLVALAIWGEALFSITHMQFQQLRTCLFIIAFFCLFSWGSTTYRQLLIANLQMAYTMKVQSFITLLKGILIGLVLLLKLSLTQYFFLLTGVVAVLIVPYSIRCRKLGLIESIKPAAYWRDFKVVITFSLSIFALSLFQMTATQSRPIILSIFAEYGAESVADFNVISVVPSFIIMVCGTFSSIFLPKASGLVTKGEQYEISRFAYKWTVFTSILACCICFPFLLGAQNVITAYVGVQYNYLTIWLVIWIVCVLFQVHSTPTNALILAYGKTKIMVYVSGIACIISIIINATLAKSFNAGSAVIGYSVYIVINLCSYYGFFYKKTLHISNVKILLSFLKPAMCGVMSMFLIMFFWKYTKIESDINDSKFFQLFLFSVKSLIWFLLFILTILCMKVVRIKNKRILTIYD